MARNPILEVFSTPELIALILAYLPAPDLLLRAPLVSPTFHLTIQTTPALQEALFFRSSNPYQNSTFRPIEINPFLSAAFPAHFQSSHTYSGAPALRYQPWSQNTDAFRRKDASWRRMLLWNGGDPEKMRKVKVVSSVQQMSGTHRRTGYLEFPEGVRMGVVWDLTRQSCQSDEKGQFGLRWRNDVWYQMDKGNVYIEKEIVCGRPRNGGLRLLAKVRGVFRRERGERRPVQTMYVQLGNRVEAEEEKEVVEIWLSTWMSCEGRDLGATEPKGLGEEFTSEGYERVKVEYGEPIRIPDSLARTRRTSDILAEAGFI